MAESPKQTQKKITSFTSESQESTGENESQASKRSTKKKSKEKHGSSSEIETTNTEQNARENLTPNGELNSTQHSTSSAASSTKHPWTFEEEETLFEKVDEYLRNKGSSEGAKGKGIFLKNIEWDKVVLCGERTKEEAKARFMLLSNRVRKTRTALEILQDMKTSHKKGSETPGGNRKRKAPVDPDLPKKPITSYMQFVQAKKAKMLEKHPDLTVIELGKKLGKRWRNLPDERKQKYSDQWHQEMEEYNQKMVEYLKNHHPDVEPPLMAYDLWAQEETKQIKNDRPDISDKKLKKKLHRRWEALEESEKTTWNEKEKKEIKKYKKRIVVAEKKANKQV